MYRNLILSYEVTGAQNGELKDDSNLKIEGPKLKVKPQHEQNPAATHVEDVDEDDHEDEVSSNEKKCRLKNFWTHPTIIDAVAQFLLNEGQSEYMKTRPQALAGFITLPVVRERAGGNEICSRSFNDLYARVTNVARTLGEISWKKAAVCSTATAAQNQLDSRLTKLLEEEEKAFKTLTKKNEPLNAVQKSTLRALGDKLRCMKEDKSILDKKIENEKATLVALGDAMAQAANCLGDGAPKTKAAAATSQSHQARIRVATHAMKSTSEEAKARSSVTDFLRSYDPKLIAEDARARVLEKTKSLEVMQQQLLDIVLQQQKQLERISTCLVANPMQATPFSATHSNGSSSSTSASYQLTPVHNPSFPEIPFPYSSSAVTPIDYPLERRGEQFSAVKRPRFHEVVEIDDMSSESSSSASSSASDSSQYRSTLVELPNKRGSSRNAQEDTPLAAPASPQLTFINNSIIGTTVIGSMRHGGGGISTTSNNCEMDRILSRTSPARENPETTLQAQYDQAVRTQNVSEVIRVLTLMWNMDKDSK